MTKQQLDIMLKFITIGIMAIVLLLFLSIWLAKHGVIPPIDLLPPTTPSPQEADASHQCMPTMTSIISHFDYINRTYIINVSHSGFCIST